VGTIVRVRVVRIIKAAPVDLLNYQNLKVREAYFGGWRWICDKAWIFGSHVSKAGNHVMFESRV